MPSSDIVPASDLPTRGDIVPASDLPKAPAKVLGKPPSGMQQAGNIAGGVAQNIVGPTVAHYVGEAGVAAIPGIGEIPGAPRVGGALGVGAYTGATDLWQGKGLLSSGKDAAESAAIDFFGGKALDYISKPFNAAGKFVIDNAARFGNVTSRAVKSMAHGVDYLGKLGYTPEEADNLMRGETPDLMQQSNKAYGAYKDAIAKKPTVDVFDPKSPNYTQNISSAFRGAVDHGDYGAIQKLALEGSAHPDTQAAMRDVVMTRMWKESTTEAGAREEGTAGIVNNLRRISNQLDSKSGGAMGLIFGQDSPMANQAVRSKIFGAIGDPTTKQKAIAGVKGMARDLMPNFMVKMLIVQGVSQATTGTNIYQLAKTDPGAAIGIGVGVMFGPKMFMKVMGGAPAAVQSAYTKMLTSPTNQKAMQAGVDSLANWLGQSQSTPQQPTATNPTPAPPSNLSP